MSVYQADIAKYYAVVFIILVFITVSILFGRLAFMFGFRNLLHFLLVEIKLAIVYLIVVVLVVYLVFHCC